MKPNESPSPKSVWPGRRIALRRLAIIALVLFPCTWIADALLVKNWNILENHDAESFRHLGEAGMVFLGVTCVVFLLSLLPGVRAFFGRLFTWRLARRVLIVCAWVVTLIALFYVEEDWRGRRAWNNYSAQLKAEGQELDFKAFIPPPIPDSENFAAIPEIQSWFMESTNAGASQFQSEWDTNIFARAKIKPPSESNEIPFRMTDLVEWQAAFNNLRSGQTFSAKDSETGTRAAQAVLAALQPSDAALDELRQAASRPYSRYPINYNLENPWGVRLPHIHDIQVICNQLELRACAELALGESDKAIEDVKLILRISDSLKDEPMLISYVLGAVTLRSAVQPVWEGLAEHRLSEGQLKELETLMGGYHFIADMKRPLEAERDAGILTADLMARGKSRIGYLIAPDGKYAAVNAITSIMPRGWFDLEKLNYCRLFNLQLQGTYNPTNGIVHPRQNWTQTIALDMAFSSQNLFTTVCIRHELLSAILLPALGRVPLSGVKAQVLADEAEIACTLERYRLVHGNFPNTLTVLSPEFISQLPIDPISGETYKYRVKPNGQFVLYSVGWNEKDDGGKMALKNGAPNIQEGDWVWEYPAK